VLINILLGEGALLEQLVDVDIELGLLVLDALVHEGLGERRLVRLVVAMLAVADEINDDVLLELGTPIGGKLADKVDSLNIIGINVEDGGVDGLGDIGAIGGGTRVAGVSGEADLVVDDKVDGTAGGEGGQGVEAQALVNNALTSEGGVTVEQDSHGSAVSLLIVVVVLDGPNLAEHDRVLGLKMRGIGHERQLDALA
jgi:hypothetical protein